LPDKRNHVGALLRLPEVPKSPLISSDVGARYGRRRGYYPHSSPVSAGGNSKREKMAAECMADGGVAVSWSPDTGVPSVSSSSHPDSGGLLARSSGGEERFRKNVRLVEHALEVSQSIDHLFA